MSKIDSTKAKLRSNPDATVMWMDGGCLPHGGYDSEEVSGIQISLMLEGYEDVYIITILPGDGSNTYDAWLRRMGSTDMIHMLSNRARDPEDVAVTAMESLPDYLGVI